MYLCVSVLILYLDNLVLCERFGTSKYLLFDSQSSLNDNDIGKEMIEEKFYADFNKHYLRLHRIRHVTVVGGSMNDLRRVHLLCKDYPSSMCTDAEKCSDPAKFSTQSLIVFFLKDLEEATLEKNVKFLSNCKSKCKLIFVSKGIAKYNEISSFLSITLKHSLVYAKLLKIERESVRLYTGVLAKNCSIQADLEFVWRPGTDLSHIHVKLYSLFSMHRCSIVISTLRYMPKMEIENNKDGRPTIIGGRDGLLVLLIAEKLNFTIKISNPPKYGNVHSSRKLGIIKQVASGIAEIGVGRLRPLQEPDDKILSSSWHDHDCITWGVPKIMSDIDNVFWAEYSWDVWALIGLVFALSCVVGYADHIIDIRRKGNGGNVGPAAIILDILAVNLGNPAVHLTLSTGGRLLLVAYLAYTTVITTGYKTSLNSALATIKNTPAIHDTRGIIAANLTVGGSYYYYQILKDQANASDFNRELVKRYVIYDNDSNALNRLKFDHDFAFLDRKVDLDYEKSAKGQSNNYNTLNECVSKYYIVMVLKKGSLLLDPINEMIQRVIESGIQQTWESYKIINEDKHPERLYAKYTRRIFISFSKFYCTALAVCTLVFFIELIVSRLKLNKNQPRRLG